ncbi:hypothetical protein GIW54_21035, partial [Pseudomonas proteolytica]|uniref:hypothetical protein n=1 Tax=Pseudomonas proteolytica TaxID=219574 RepID=UPI001F331C2D
MSYGLTFTNNDNVVTLDSEFSRLVILDSGTWAGSGGIGIAFTSVITTDEPPLVFVRPDQDDYFASCLVQGNAGNWHAFRFNTLKGSHSSGKWFIAAFKSSPIADYGLRLWDATSKIIFDSGTPCAQFTRTISAWNYLGAEQTQPGVYRYSWSAFSPTNTGDYMLLNNIAMDMAGTVSRQGVVQAVLDYGGEKQWDQNHWGDTPAPAVIFGAF